MIGAKFALTALVVPFLLVGMLATVTGNERASLITNRQATPAPANKNFLASLRFWENNKTSEHSHTPNTRIPQETPAETRNVPTGRQVDAARRPATPELAPEPPSIPLVEHRTGLGSAPLPGWSAHFAYDTNENESSIPQEVRPRMASHVSYSFDARDWVEYYPHQQEIRQPEDRDETLRTIQTTSLHAPTTHMTTQYPTVSQSHDNENSGENNHWDGQATRIASIREEIHRLQQNHTSSTPVPSAEVLTHGKPPSTIDLTPSYQRLLPHVQTCEVVVVQANFPLTEIATILDEINQLQHDLTRYIGVPVAKEKIELCLFKDEKSYMDFLKEYFPRAPRDRRALYIKLDKKPGTLMVQKSKDFEVDLRHEMTHAIIHASIPRIPIWLDEGLAKYFEVPPQDRENNHPYMMQIRRNARLGTIPSLANLTKLETIDDMGTKEYRDSWAWTHFLIRRSPETHRLLAAYLQMLANLPEESARADSQSIGIVSVFTEKRQRSSIPSLKLYLDDIMPNQRESFREHFGAIER